MHDHCPIMIIFTSSMLYHSKRYIICQMFLQKNLLNQSRKYSNNGFEEMSVYLSDKIPIYSLNFVLNRLLYSTSFMEFGESVSVLNHLGIYQSKLVGPASKDGKERRNGINRIIWLSFRISLLIINLLEFCFWLTKYFWTSRRDNLECRC